MTDGLASPIKLVVDKHELLNVHYLESLAVSIGVQNQDQDATMVVESLALRFKSRRPSLGGDSADPYATVIYPGQPLAIPPGKLGSCTIQVIPNLVFLRYTNYFDVAVTYRLHNETLGKRRSFIGEGWFAIINPAPQLFGKVFISYKEPEDRIFADLLFDLAKDAGFDPYIAPADVKTGRRIWGRKIPAAIKASKFMFVIWTSNAPKGPGVKREIRIARECKIEIVPLLKRKTPDPKLFGHDIEYTRFGDDDAALIFAEVVAARRGM
jgi:hypothetical protein